MRNGRPVSGVAVLIETATCSTGPCSNTGGDEMDVSEV